MPDETKKAEAEAPEISEEDIRASFDFKVKRNDVDLEFVGHQKRVTKEDPEGLIYPAPDVEEETFLDVTKWLGGTIVASWVGGKIRQWCQAVYKECIKDGVFNLAQFQQKAQEFVAREESIKELRDARDVLLKEMMAFVSNPDKAARAYVEGTAEQSQFKALGAKINNYTIAIEGKSRKKAEAEAGKTEEVAAAAAA